MSERIIRQMSIDDYQDALLLWKKTEGIGLSEADSKEKIAEFLVKNRGLCLVCEENKRLKGTLLCGTDGRRGYIYHLAVEEENRRTGIGMKLVQKSLSELKKMGIEKCHIFVFDQNIVGKEFWKRIGWSDRADILIYSKNT